jgi:chorismate synthase
MKIERDRAEILAGVANGLTTGAPIALMIENKDWANWKDSNSPKLTVPRPGHADLAGKQKYAVDDMRLILERASARATAMQVAIGTLAKALLSVAGVRVYSHVVRIGTVQAPRMDLPPVELYERAERSAVRCADEPVSAEMCAEIDRAKAERDTLGGVFEVIAVGLPVGLGSHVHWDRRLGGRLAHAVMGIQAVKGVEIGDGFALAAERGTAVHDELLWRDGQPARYSNHAGGLEGGMTNGEPVVLRAAMKPIATTLKPLRTIDLATGENCQSQYERSDHCAVPAASVVAEAMVAWVLADALVEKFAGDSVAELRANMANYQGRLRLL